MLHARKLLLFVALSLADLLLTWWLLRQQEDGLYESNPLACWCLEAYGWAGLAALKVGCVLSVTALALAISRRRPRAGGRVLGLGCAALAVVVLYSSSLLGMIRSEDQRLATEEAELDRQTHETLDFLNQKDRWSNALHAGPCTLAEAVADLAGSPRARDSNWLVGLHAAYPDRSDEEGLALALISFILDDPRYDLASAERLKHTLEEEFWSLYGTDPRLEPVIRIPASAPRLPRRGSPRAHAQ